MEATSHQLNTLLTAALTVSPTKPISDNSTPTTQHPPHHSGSRIVYTRNQLVSLKSTGQGCRHEIPKDLKRRRRGCRAGLRHREKMIMKRAMEEMNRLGPFIGIHGRPGAPPRITVELEWPRNVPMYYWDNGELVRLHGERYDDSLYYGDVLLEYSEYYTLDELAKMGFIFE